MYKSYVKEGDKEGLPTQEYMEAHLKTEGVWTEKDDKEVADIKNLIERLVEGKKVIYLKSDLDRQNQDIEENEKKYYAKKAQKDKLLGLTAEMWAEKKVNEHYIIQSFYLDEQFKQKYLTDDFYDGLSEVQMQDIVHAYNEEMETVGDKNIKRLAIQEFFQVYWSLSTENLFNFFGRPICDLTYFQVKLGSYGRMFKNLLEGADKLPEEVRTDPDKLLDYIRTGENAKERMEKAAQNSPDNDVVASTLIGAKNEDYKAVGITSDSTVSLSSELKRKTAEGKQGLDMHDLMKMHGV